MTFDINNLPFIKAQYFKSVPAGRKIRVLVVHDMEADETQKTAVNVANYFAKCPVTASAHYCIDSDTVIRCVLDKDVAFAAPGCNSDGIQLELAGYGKQTREDWLDNYSYKVLVNAADIAAQECLAHDIPLVHLTDEQLLAGEKGVVGHYQVSAVYKKSDHTDPGAGFPWDFLMDEIGARVLELKGAV